MITKFSRGAWKAETPYDNGDILVVKPRQQHEWDTVAQVAYVGNGETEANANLIASAPDLYRMLESAVEILEIIGKEDIQYHAPLIISDARQALRKARGEA